MSGALLTAILITIAFSATGFACIVLIVEREGKKNENQHASQK